jgi:signal transduction histidine kinase
MQPPLTTTDAAAGAANAAGAAPAAPPRRLARAVLDLSERHGRVVLVAMLVLLHFAVLRGTTDVWARALLLAHLGLVLMWQPFVRRQEQVSTAQAVAIGFAGVVVMLWLNGWLLAVWVIALAGIVGGVSYQQYARWQRRAYLLVFAYLLALLVVIILPEIAPRREMSPEIREIAEYGLPLLIVAVMLVPVESDTAQAFQLIDFFYSLFLVLLLTVIVLGSFTFMTLGNKSYLEALTYTVLGVGAGVLLFGLAWNPPGRFAGLSVFFSRYLLSIGLPLERWLYFLAGLSQSQQRPERFLAEGVEGLLRLPWISGAIWRSARGDGSVGVSTGHTVELTKEELSLVIYSRFSLSPALRWHLLLLSQLLAEFYVAKLREEQLQNTAYLQAVHETGARLAHEVKNILQSLSALASVRAAAEPVDAGRAAAFFDRQLPLIQARLTETLEKLRRPLVTPERQVDLDAWWEALCARYPNPGVDFVGGTLHAEVWMPGSLFDHVVDNLLQNALAKRNANPAVRIRVTLDAADGGVRLRVEDTGAAVRPEVEATLLHAPVRSDSGLGIGLYQAARQAAAQGYRLVLEENRDGAVRFALLPEAQGSTPAAVSRP